jgi:hypothetical protein
VRNLRLRDEPPPGDHVVVIRGGVVGGRTDDQLRDRARQSEHSIGLLAQSVLLADAEDVARVCLQDGRVSRYARVSLSTVARIRQAGFPLEATLDTPHYSVVFPDLSAQTIERFRNCFDPAQANPPMTLPR